MSTVLLATVVDEEIFRRASARANAVDKTLDLVLAAYVKRYGALVPAGKKGKRKRKATRVAGLSVARRGFGVAAAPPPAAPLPEAPAFQTYIVQPGDSLSKIAKLFYGDANRYALIGQYNNLADYRYIYPGQELKIPTLAPVPEPPAPPVTPQPVQPTPPQPAEPVLRAGPFPEYPPFPDGLEQIKRVFGEFEYEDRSDVPGNITITDNWQAENIIVQQNVPILPKHRIWCHKKVAPLFVNVFSDIENADLADLIRSYDGCYNPRHKMHNPKLDLSVHSWGIAIDINASTNMPGTKGDMDPQLVEIFEKHGFYWGGNFGDPMHFQYCTSY